MNKNTAPTKANLLAAKRSLSLAERGYDLLDRKRLIMMREMLRQMDGVKKMQREVSEKFAEAYIALRNANISMGREDIRRITASAETVDDIEIRYRSIMGVEIPEVFRRKEKKPGIPFYGLVTTTPELDSAYDKFCEIRELTLELAAIENSVYRLAAAIKKSEKRANALYNIIIPDLKNEISYIQDSLEERERESFATQKVIKNSKTKNKK